MSQSEHIVRTLTNIADHDLAAQLNKIADEGYDIISVSSTPSPDAHRNETTTRVIAQRFVDVVGRDASTGTDQDQFAAAKQSGYDAMRESLPDNLQHKVPGGTGTGTDTGDRSDPGAGIDPANDPGGQIAKAQDQQSAQQKIDKAKIAGTSKSVAPDVIAAAGQQVGGPASDPPEEVAVAKANAANNDGNANVDGAAVGGESSKPSSEVGGLETMDPHKTETLTSDVH